MEGEGSRWRREVEELKQFVRQDREKVLKTAEELSALITKEDVLVNRLCALMTRRGSFVRRLLDVLGDRSLALAEKEDELLEGSEEGGGGGGGGGGTATTTGTEGTSRVEASGRRAEEELLDEEQVLSEWQEK